MSLQVWLPLTKDTRNQGLSSISITGSPTAWNDGKLGKCAYWNGAVANVLYNNTTDFNYTNNFSVAFWANPVYTGSNAQYAWTVGRADAGSYGYGFQIISATTARFRFGNGSYDVSAPSNEWHHFAMTIGNSKVTIYKDGIQISSNNLPGTLPTYGDGNGIGLGCFHYSGDIYPYYGSLNDFRIYDHCLSPMEVKELSKGLVLHYPLDNNGVGGENLFKKTREVFDNNGSRLSSTTVINGLIIDSNAPNGKYRSWNIVAENGASRGIYYTYTDSNIALEDLTANEIYTLSFWSRCSKTKNLVIGSLAESQTVQKVDGGDIPSSGDIVVDNNWKKHSVTFKWTSTSKITTCFYLRSLDENVTLDIASPKLEKGSKATPWCPNKNDELATAMGLNDGIEYDTSGFCNNGTRTGTFSWASDTPKYSVSQSFNGTDNVITLPSISNILQNSFTMNVWFRKNELGSKNYETLFGGPSGFEMDTRAEGASTLTLYMPSPRGGTSYTSFQFGEWYMVTLVNDGTNELYYINGELVKTIEKKAMPNGTYFIGAWNSITSQNYKGLMSDFRIYATALSAEDILSLYQASAYIDSQGNTFASSYVEG